MLRNKPNLQNTISLRCSEAQIMFGHICATICTSDQRRELLNGLIICRAKTRRFRNTVTMMERRPESRLSDTPRRPRRSPVVPCAAVTQMSNRAAALKQWTACELLHVVSGSLTVTYSAKVERYPESKSSWWRLALIIYTHSPITFQCQRLAS